MKQYALLYSMMICCSTSLFAQSAVEKTLNMSKVLNSLNTEDLHATIDLYKAQVNQENIVLLGDLLNQRLQQNLFHQPLKTEYEQNMSNEYADEYQRVLLDFAQQQLPKVIEQSSPLVGKQLEQAVQQIDSKQLAEVLTEPKVQKNIGKVIKFFEQFQ